MIKQVDDALYSMICQWWDGHGWTAVPREMLPPHGYVVFLEDKPIAAAFLYKGVDCSFGFMDWVISDPKSSHSERDIALSVLLNHIQEVAKAIGLKAYVTMTKNKSLIKKYSEKNFVPTDTETTVFLKGV